MAETPSTMLPLGTKAPHFTLPDSISGKSFSLEELKSDKATVIMFICNHCPYVQHILDKLIETITKYQKADIHFVAINSNDVTKYPADAPDKMRELAMTHQFTFPYLYDETQQIAKAYQAACTPDFYVFDNHLKCIYRGRFDASTPGNGKPVTGNDLSSALDAALASNLPDTKQFPSVGCNIKWKKV
jgi:thiol-disulfide isomerase/thioredoxin